MVVEIFSHLKSHYSFFRTLNTRYRYCKIPWDGWDALIDRGYRVEIDDWQIEWHKGPRKSGEWFSTLHRGGDLPAIVSVEGDRSWYKNGERHRDGGLPAVIATQRCNSENGGLKSGG